MENLEALAFEVVQPLVEQFGTSICLDVGHLAFHGGDEMEFLSRHWDHIRIIHLHDAMTLSTGGYPHMRDHLPLEQGDIDYKSFLHTLEETGYDGVIILENNSKADLEESLERIKNFL